MRSPILETGAKILLPVFLLFSLFILFRGHNVPGGGFIGGLIFAAGFALYGFAFGFGAAQKRLRIDPRTLGVTGLIAAICAGLMPALTGDQPFTGLWASALPVSSVMLFDIGVYLAVAGAILTLIFALEEG